MILGGPPLSDRHRRALDVAAVGTAAWVGLLYVLGAASAGRGAPGRAVGSVLRGAGLLLVLLGGWFLLRPLWLALASWAKEAAGEFTVHFEGVLAARPRWPILLLSFIGLYAEIMLIRWQSSLFQVFAFFKNISLLSCFLGLGLGLALKDRKSLLLPLVPLGLALQIIPLHLLQGTPRSEQPDQRRAAHGAFRRQEPVRARVRAALPVRNLSGDRVHARSRRTGSCLGHGPPGTASGLWPEPGGESRGSAGVRLSLGALDAPGRLDDRAAPVALYADGCVASPPPRVRTGLHAARRALLSATGFPALRRPSWSASRATDPLQ